MELEFRILKISDIEFVIQREMTKTTFSGFWFWKKEFKEKKWVRVDETGFPFYADRYSNNINLLITYSCFKDAQKWIADYYKYPIIHEVK